MDLVILLVAFGRNGYAYSAYNLAKSIKQFTPQIPIHLAHDGCLDNLETYEKLVFDSNEVFDNEFKQGTNGAFCPGKVKLNLDKLAPTKYNKVLYLDVDSLCLKSIEPLLEQLNGNKFSTRLFGSGGKIDKIEYSPWASNELIWQRMELKEDAILSGLNTSYIYFERCEEVKQLFDELKNTYAKFSVKDLLLTWSGTMPDELIYASTIAKLGLKVHSLDDLMFFGNKLEIKSIDEMISKYYFLSMYGPGGARALTRQRYIEWYDGFVKGYGYKSKYIMRDKHLTHFVK